MAERLHGDRPRPWLLAIGLGEDSPFAEELRGLFPTIRFLSAGDPVRDAEYNAAVVLGDPPSLASHIQIVQFGGDPTASAPGKPDGIWRLVVEAGDRAERFVSGTEDGEDDTGSLAAATLLPEPGSAYEVLRWRSNRNYRDTSDRPEVVAFASEFAGDALAGRVRRRPRREAGELWWLPERTTRRGEWVAAALRHWQREYPDLFPAHEKWRSLPDWSTEAEARAREALAAQQASARAALAQLGAEEAELAAALERARLAADAAERRLVTSQGRALVEEVVAALEELGFTVQDADDLPENASEKQEDLRITDGQWTCLAEVKGYEKRGAKSNDLLQVGKAVEAYILREGKRPDARWYVVNQMFCRPPGERPKALAGSTSLGTFAEQGGLVVDTRDLFRIREAVRRGEVAAGTARDLLREPTGVFEYPAPDTHE